MAEKTKDMVRLDGAASQASSHEKSLNRFNEKGVLRNMKNKRAGLLCVILMMLLLSISTAYSQQSSASDQQIIKDLNQLRMELLQKLIAIIPVKVHFSMNEAAAVQNCTKGVIKSCTYTFKTGEVLSETKDNRGYLINDSFQDPANHLILSTEYTIYNRPFCYTLIDTLKQVGIKVCYPCHNNTTDIVWTNQTVRDYKTGNTLIATLNCCGNITSVSYEKLPGMAFALSDPCPHNKAGTFS